MKIEREFKYPEVAEMFQVLDEEVLLEFAKITQMLGKNKKEENKRETLYQEGLDYALNHPTFPLNYSQNKLTREEMNER